MTQPPPAAQSRPGLHNLNDVKLTPENARVLAGLDAASLGAPAWKARKHAELYEFLALAQLAPARMKILALDASTEIRAWIALRCAVPCLPPGAVDIAVEHEAHLAVRYPEEILWRPLPGTALVELLQPAHVFHPNVSPGVDAPPGAVAGQRLCLGVRVPRGLPLREVALMCYSALTLQSVQVDERDAAGVLNLDAARFWQQRPERMPLSRVAFLSEAVS